MARKNIQGITIEIGGDTTKLQSALKGVENKLKDTQAALKDTNRLLKLDPGNVELLTQKQKLLTDSIQGTEEKLKILRDASEQASAAMANGDEKAKAQYDALQREIIETEQQLKSLTTEIKNFGSVAAQQIAAAGKSVQELGGKITKAGTVLTKNVTAPIVAVGAASVAAFNEVDEGLDIIIKKTGASGKALEDMETRAKNLTTSIPTDFQTAGAAIGEVNTRFGLTGDALEKLSGQFIKFAKLNDTDVSSSIDNVQAAMTAFGVPAHQAASALDILNKAAQDTGVDVTKLTGDMTSNAAALQEMGFRFNGAAGFLAKMNKNGLDSGTVLTGMKKALQKATKEGKTMSQALQEIQTSIAGAKSDTEALQIATNLFGSKAAPALVKAIKEGRLSFNELSNAVQDTAGSVSKTFENTLDPMDEFKMALNEIKIVGAELVTAAAPMIKKVAQGLKKGISDLRKWWEGLSPLQQETVIKIGAIVAAAGPLLIVVGKITTAVGSIMTLAPKIVGLIGTVKTALSGLWAVLAANPIGLVIAAVAALAAGFTYLWRTSESFRNFWIGLWDGIKSTATRVADATKSVLIEKWDNIKNAYQEHGGGLQGIAAATMEAIKARYTTGFDILNRLLGGKLDGVKKVFSDAWKAAVSTVQNAIEKIKSYFNFDWKLPKIKMPHFSIQGSFSLNPPSVPRLNVDWYKKAMENGMILNSPTIFGAAGNRLLGGGEAGPEAVVGTSALSAMIAEAVARGNQGGPSASRGGPRNLTVILELDRQQLGRAVYRLNNDEAQRVGVKLAGGGA